jgi:hypothetical protein
MKYCHDCLTPIKRDSKEEYCYFCKRDRLLKENSKSAAYRTSKTSSSRKILDNQSFDATLQ